MKQVDRYLLDRVIAVGHRATIYQARVARGSWRVVVAVKRLHRALHRDSSIVARFQEGGRLATLVNHPNVIVAYDSGDCGGHYLVLQHVEGLTLQTLMDVARATCETIPRPILGRILLDTVEGVRAIQEIRDVDGTDLQVVHRGIAPRHLLVGADGVTRVADLGLAQTVRIAVPRGCAGVAGYAAPEQAAALPVDHRADVYALGVVAWEALANQRFPVRAGASSAPRLRGLAAPRPLEEVVRTALAPDPEARFSNAAVLRDALAAALVDGDLVAGPSEVTDFVDRTLALLARATTPAARPGWVSGRDTTTPGSTRWDLLAHVSHDETTTDISSPSPSALVDHRLGDLEVTNVSALVVLRRAVRSGVDADLTSNAEDAKDGRERAAWRAIQAITICLLKRLYALRAARSEEVLALLPRPGRKDLRPYAVRQLDGFLRGGKPPSLAVMSQWFTDDAAVPSAVCGVLRSSLGVVDGVEADLANAGDIRNVLAHLPDYETTEADLDGRRKSLPPGARRWLRRIDTPEGSWVVVRSEAIPWLEWLATSVLERRLRPRPAAL